MHVVSVVVPAKGAVATLTQTLAALRAQDLDAPFEVVVVDNGSDDAIARIAAGFGDLVRLVRTKPTWPGVARNAGVEVAGAAAIAFTDADCVPDPSWLRTGVAALADADIVQGAVVPDPRAVAGPFDRSVSVSGLALFETANLFVDRELFARVGGFDDWMKADIRRPFGEDVWFGWRAIRLGARATFCADAVVSHAVLPRGASGYVGERRRLALFCALTSRVPELRRAFFYRRWFLSRHSARFDAAVVGAAAAFILALGGGHWLAVAPFALAIPYLRHLYRRARPWGRRAPIVASTEVAADAVRLAALLAGSARFRALLL